MPKLTFSSFVFVQLVGDHPEREPLPGLERLGVPDHARRHRQDHPALPLHDLAGFRSPGTAPDPRPVCPGVPGTRQSGTEANRGSLLSRRRQIWNVHRLRQNFAGNKK